MELVKRRITMEDRTERTKAMINVDEDRFLTENEPEAKRIIGKKCHVEWEEPQIQNEILYVTGRFLYELLCEGDIKNQLFSIKGEIPFSEEQRLQGNCEEAEVYIQIEDFSPELVHSKKIRILGLFTMEIEEIRELAEEIATDLQVGRGEVEVRRKNVNYLELIAKKKDILKLNQEITLPNNNPDIGKILWEEVGIRALDHRAKEGKIAVSGELVVFVIYQSEGMEEEISYYETAIPFSEYLEMRACHEDMVVECNLLSIEEKMDPKQDFDGENRVLHLEIGLYFAWKLYAEEELEIMEDVYGIDKEIKGVQEQLYFQKLLYVGEGKKKLVDEFVYEKSLDPAFGSPIHVQSDCTVDGIEEQEDGILVNGFLRMQLLTEEQKEDKHYVLLDGQIPYQYQIPIKMKNREDAKRVYLVRGEVEQISAHVPTEGVVEVRAMLNYKGYVYETCRDSGIREVTEEPIDQRKQGELPSICIYYPREGETIWEIGKKYAMPIEQIKEQNHLTREQLHQGEKLLLMKTFHEV